MLFLPKCSADFGPVRNMPEVNPQFSDQERQYPQNTAGRFVGTSVVSVRTQNEHAPSSTGKPAMRSGSRSERILPGESRPPSTHFPGW